jgi:hypothetical protein
MTFENLGNTIVTKVKTLLDAMTDPVVALRWENQEEDPPEQGVWVKTTVLTPSNRQAELGANKRFRCRGTVVMQIFNEQGLGTRDHDRVVDTLISQTGFRATTENGVTYQTPQRITVGRSGHWWQINVEVPFYADDTE